MRLLLIRVDDGPTGGREQLSSILNDNLRRIVGDDLRVYELRPNVRSSSILSRFIGRIDGITPEVEKDLLNLMLSNAYDCVFIDGSNLGRIARLLSKSNNAVPIVTFYHNVESRFFFDAMRAAPSVRSLGVLISNTIAEHWAAKYSKRRVMLNQRDTLLHARLYRYPGTDVLPMALRDQYNPTAVKDASPWDRPYALFVGGAFYANVEGMAWYAERVAPHAPLETIVIGRGMNVHRARLEQWGGVRVVGEVDELVNWYAHAKIIVAPIMSGSGMKTKTAEALMHGKPIAGTIEAFEGYNMMKQDGLTCCRTPADFLEALQGCILEESGFDPRLRKRYVQNHSEDAMRKTLKNILENALCNELT